MKTPYGFGTHLNLPYDEAVRRVKDALKTEGFGVLTEIDVRKTMREKLGIEQIGPVADEAKQRLERVVAVLSGQN